MAELSQPIPAPAPGPGPTVASVLIGLLGLVATVPVAVGQQTGAGSTDGSRQDAEALEARIASAATPWVRFSFAARRGVCGGRGSAYGSRESCGCQPGPVRVTLRRNEDGGVVVVMSRVGGSSWPGERGERPEVGMNDVTDLGRVSAPAAADYLLGLAESRRGEVAEDAITPAALADSVTTWPRLLRIAEDPGRSAEIRKRSLFWVAQAAAATVTDELTGLTEDERQELEVREHAVFALSQRPASEAVPALVHVVRENENPELRRKALFWLGQMDDPRVVELFEEILTAGRD